MCVCVCVCVCVFARWRRLLVCLRRGHRHLKKSMNYKSCLIITLLFSCDVMFWFKYLWPPWRKYYVIPKRRYPSTKLRDVTTQTTFCKNVMNRNKKEITILPPISVYWPPNIHFPLIDCFKIVLCKFGYN